MKRKIITLMLAFTLTTAMLAGCGTSDRQDVSASTDAVVNENEGEMEKRISDLEDKQAIQDIVDDFSILADQKDAATQAELFTEDAVVEIVMAGAEGSEPMVINGRQAIGDTFNGVLTSFDTVYHINGQTKITLNGDDTATGVVYCQAVLIGEAEGNRSLNTEGVYYNDEYQKIDGKWYISKRTSTFSWTDSKTVTIPEAGVDQNANGETQEETEGTESQTENAE